MKKISKSVVKQIINIAVLLVLVGLTLLVLWSSNRELDFGAIGAFIARANPWWTVAAFGCMAAFVLTEAVSLHIIARTVGERPKFFSSVVYSAADLYYAAITPSAAGGQPAAVFYMSRDGMNPARATFSMVVNLAAYAAAMLLLGIFAFIARPAAFLTFDGLTQTLVILGVVVQVLLFGLFVACMFWHRAVLQCGNALIRLGRKMHIVKNEEKWRDKLAQAVVKYADCLTVLRAHKGLFAPVLLLNIAQRVSVTLTTCFVCLAGGAELNFFEIFVLQAYVMLGYNSVPLPGGVGAFEYVYLHVYGLVFDDAFILAAMMITRAISYYICLAVSGLLTLTYHAATMRRVARRTEEKRQQEEDAQAPPEQPKEETTAEGEEQPEESPPQPETEQRESEEPQDT